MTHDKHDPRNKQGQKPSTVSTTPLVQMAETPRLNIAIRPQQRTSTSTAIASIAGDEKGPGSMSSFASQLQGAGMMSREAEDNFITELWSTLNVDQKQAEWQMIEYDSRTVQFTLSPRFAASGQTISSGYGVRYVNELLKRCSECRSQLLAMRRIGSSGRDSSPDALSVEETSSLPPSTAPNALIDQLSSLLSNPLRSVVKKFYTDTMTDVQESSITIRDMAQFSTFLINFKQRVEKVYSFFKPPVTADLSTPSSLAFGSSTGSAFSAVARVQKLWQEVMLAEKTWHRFLLLLNAHSPRELDDELPVWERVHKEMLQMLGRYFDLLCRLRVLHIPPPASNASIQQSQSQQWQMTDDGGAAAESALSRSSSHSSMHKPISRLPTPMVSGELSQLMRVDESRIASGCGGGEGSQFFRLIWTDRLRADLQGAFHHEERIAAGGISVPGACTFQELFKQQADQGGSSGSLFKDVIQHLESAASSYRAQYEHYIMQGVVEGGRLQTALGQIKALYTLRTFVHPVTCIMRTPNDGWLDTLTSALADEMGGESGGNQWQLVRRPVTMECITSEEEMNGSAASSGSERHPQFAPRKQPWWSFELECKLQWPLECVLGVELFAVLNKCMERCQQMLNAYNTIVQLVADGRDTIGSVMRNRPARRKRLLAQKLQDTIRVVYTVLRSEMENRIDKAAAALLQAKTVGEMECVVHEWITGLDIAIAGSEQFHRESYVLTAADTLCGLIDSFQSLQQKCAEDKGGVLAQASALKVEKMLKKLDRVTLLLTSPLYNYSSLSGQQPSATSMAGGEKWAPVLPSSSSGVAYSIALLLSR